MAKEKKMKTYEFHITEPIDEFETVQFCAFSKNEAESLFVDYCLENGYKGIPAHKTEIVFNAEDKACYEAEGINYYVP